MKKIKSGSVAVKGRNITLSGDYAKLVEHVANEKGCNHHDALKTILVERLPEVKAHLLAQQVLPQAVYNRTRKVCDKLGVPLSEFIRQAVTDQARDAIADTAVALCIHVAAGVRPASDWEADQAEFRARCAALE